jgi:acyl-CoA synthetase (AMP-forming)/AMP-acid ligase II
MSYVRLGMALFESYDGEEAIVHGERRLTYADLNAAVNATAESLLRDGIRPGDGVAVAAGNTPEAVVAQLALHLLGCRSAWIASNAPETQRADFLAMAKVDHHLTELDVVWRPTGDVVVTEVVEPESLFQTGGTTGRPKLVHHRHDFFANVLASAQRNRAAGGARLRQLAVAGFWHSSAQASALITLFSGGTLVQHNGFDAGEFLATVERESITVATLPPPMLYLLLDHPALATTDTGSLTMLACAGSAIAPSRLQQAIERFGPVLLPAYGMSEITLIAAYPTSEHDPAHPQRLSSCGKPIAPARVEIRDETGRSAEPGVVGDVWANARLMMSGYWGQPELTEQTLVDGWLRTGDLGYFDADGYLYLVDRAKDMIVTGLTSTNVYSRTVEDALCAHPQVAAAAVIGVPDPELGEAVHAYVRLIGPARVTGDELRGWVVARLNELWAPKTVEIVAELPLTALGKLDKRALRQLHAAGTRTPAPAPSSSPV